ncbi:MAG: hypothetical protein HZB67_06215 [Candidatus Aenigmarchaeota archaeon]|nr:hypothetical protein [Candidatus Aenigmarchaeota archaeon]
MLPGYSGVKLGFDGGAYLQFNCMPNSMIGINVSKYRTTGAGNPEPVSKIKTRILAVEGKDVSEKCLGPMVSKGAGYDNIPRTTLDEDSFGILKKEILGKEFKNADPTFWTENWVNLHAERAQYIIDVHFRFEKGSLKSVFYEPADENNQARV